MTVEIISDSPAKVEVPVASPEQKPAQPRLSLRERKPTIFHQVVTLEAKKKELPTGSGVSLGAIEFVQASLPKASLDTQKRLHRILYSSEGKQNIRLREIRKFTGVTGEDQEKALKNRIGLVKHVSVLKDVAGVFGLAKNLQRDQLIDELHAFLVAPKDLGTAVPTKKRKRASVASTKKSKKGTKKSKKQKKDPNAPKKPPSAFFVFAAEKRPSLPADLKITEKTTELGKMWGTLTDEEKVPYQKKADELKEQYLKDKEEYLSKQESDAKAARKAKRDAKKSDKAEGAEEKAEEPKAAATEAEGQEEKAHEESKEDELDEEDIDNEVEDAEDSDSGDENAVDSNDASDAE